MIRKTIPFILLLALITAVSVSYNFVQAQAAPQNNSWQAKVDPWILQTADPALATNGTLPQTEFLVYLAEQGDVSHAHTLPTKDEKGAYIYQTLTAVAKQTQPAIVSHLQTVGAPYRQYWILNMIWVKGDITLIQTLAQRNDVARLIANPTVPMESLPTTPQQMQTALQQAIEWNINLVNAPDVWAAGVTGAGAVIGGQDTGYDWDHPALINQYRGWDGTTADHDYNWHDSVHVPGSSCGADSPEPCDDHGHGTHTMGTMVGNDLDPANPGWPASATNAVGMAPGAKWIGCRNMNAGDGSPATYSECYEWFIAPYPVGGDPITDGDPTKAPHVINNSWGCPASEGCTTGTELHAIVQNVVAAGIVTVHSAGNAGSSCGSVNTPSATYDESFSVGATTSSDVIASYSSRGPSAFDNGRKPDISAPGSSIRSSTPNGGYGSSSGTSMAGPHVAGLVGLLISAQPSLAGQVDAIEQLIEQTAVPKTSNQGCGGDSPTDVPNNVYGYGRIDAYNAYLQTDSSQLTLNKTAASDVTAGDAITYTLSVNYSSSTGPTHNIVLTDLLPVGTSFITATLPHTFDGTAVEWQLPSLDDGDAWQVELVVGTAVTSTGTVDNITYSVYSDELAPVFGAPVQTSLTPVDFDLSLSKTASATEVNAGDWLTYTLSVQNLSAHTTHNLVLTDVLPVDTSFITATLPHTFDGTAVEWQSPSLDAGETWQVELVVSTAVTSTGTVDNTTYSVYSDEVAPVAGTAVVTPIKPVYRIYLPIILGQ